MIHSFRLRLALLASLLSGVALVVFGLGAWWMIRDIKIARIDSDVRSTAEREVSRTRSADDWERVESDLISGMGVRERSDFLLLVEDRNGQAIYRTQKCSPSMRSVVLPWPLATSVDKSTSRHEEKKANLLPDTRSDTPPGPPTGPPPGPPPATALFAKTLQGRHWRFGLASTENERIAVAVDEHVVDTEMEGVRNAFFLALPLALALIGFGAWLFSGRALHPLQKLTTATQRVTAEALNQRIQSKGEDDEFVTLIDLFNGMLQRLEVSFRQARRFSADAAHELKTPLAILQGQVERALHAAEDGSPMQIQLTNILDEVRNLSTITNKLLLLSLADAGHLKVHRESLNVSSLLQELVEDTQMLAPHLLVSGEFAANLEIQADGNLLQQVLHNLISNAIKYNVEGGWIRIIANSISQGIEVRVVNSSKGIPDTEHDRIFERFYRVDAAHSRNMEGAGMGLSVSREIARAHGGEITLKTSEDNSVEFCLFMPLA